MPSPGMMMQGGTYEDQNQAGKRGDVDKAKRILSRHFVDFVGRRIVPLADVVNGRRER
jgi:hypothetical protein